MSFPFDWETNPRRIFRSFSSNFTVDIQRYISAQLDKHKYVINGIPGDGDKVEFRKGSNKNISLLIPNSV